MLAKPQGSTAPKPGPQAEQTTDKPGLKYEVEAMTPGAAIKIMILAVSPEAAALALIATATRLLKDFAKEAEGQDSHEEPAEEPGTIPGAPSGAPIKC